MSYASFGSKAVSKSAAFLTDTISVPPQIFINSNNHFHGRISEQGSISCGALHAFQPDPVDVLLREGDVLISEVMKLLDAVADDDSTVPSEDVRVYGPQAYALQAPAADLKDHGKVLHRLGSTRRSQWEPFIDAAPLHDAGAPEFARGGHFEFFPQKIAFMLQQTAQEGRDDIVSFLPHGRAFRIHDWDRFSVEILPRFFPRHKEISTFTRQLHLYGFLKLRERDEGAYYHPLFLRGHPNLIRYMRRVGVPKKKGLDRPKKKDHYRLPDPDFYSMPALR
jgi:hypothetical protein